MIQVSVSKWMGVCLAVGGLLACSRSDQPQAGGDSATHWLMECEDDGDCGPLSCLCGLCTQACDDDDPTESCGRFGATASCESAASECGDAPGARACAAVCERDGDCPEDATCVDERYCLRSASVSAGPGPSNAPDPKTQPPGPIVPTPGPPGVLDGCAEQDATGRGECEALFGWAFKEGRCQAIHCTCEGSDCGALFADASDCFRAARDCFAVPVSEAELTCEQSTDCLIEWAGPGCCRGCAPFTQDNSLATTRETQFLQGLCPGATCAFCEPPVQSHRVVPACQAGVCRVVSLDPVSACTRDEQCIVRTWDCCACNSDLSPSALIAVSDEQAFNALACGQPSCDECEGTLYPDDVEARCQDGTCQVVF